MPSISQTPISPPNGKKRRREEFDVQMKLSRQAEIPANDEADRPNPGLSLTCSPSPQRLRLDPRDAANDTNNERRQMTPKSRRTHHLRRQRVELHPAARTDEHTQAGPGRGEVGGGTGKIDLSPCHICNRKPTEKRELDGFADCQGCSGRMCYICMRECLGSAISARLEGREMDSDRAYNVLSCSFGKDREHSKENGMENGGEGENGTVEKGCIEHRRFICSRCCVEKGEQGEVLCLGCFRVEKIG